MRQCRNLTESDLVSGNHFTVSSEGQDLRGDISSGIADPDSLIRIDTVTSTLFIVEYMEGGKRKMQNVLRSNADRIRVVA